MTDSIHQAACSVARSDTLITTVSPQDGPASIENFHDESASVIGVIEEVRLGIEDDFDAFIIACYGDPGLYAAREISPVPVVGIAEASMYMASVVAARFSVVTVITRIKTLIEDVVRRYGMAEKCNVRTTNLSVLDFELNPEKGMAELREESKKAIEENGAEAICLGCAGMVRFADDLEKELGIPVFDGVTAAVKMAEGLVDLRKKTSKRLTYKYPEKKEYKGILTKITP